MGTKYHNAHEVKKGDPKLNGPYLDDVRAEQEEAYRDARKKASKKAGKKKK